MPKERLTKNQRLLMEELDKIVTRVGQDYWNILDRERPARTPVLEAIERTIIRGEVVDQYTLLDEALASKVCQYMFGKERFVALWKTRRFERFNYFILERMSFPQKLAFVKDVYNVPASISKKLEAINALRNALAHAFFPENLRAYRAKAPGAVKGPTYRGVQIFTFDGIDRFLDDSTEIAEFLFLRMKRKKKLSKLSTLTPPASPASEVVVGDS